MMNQRIKELAIEADIMAPTWNHVPLGYQKFAELIVFECTKAVMDGTKEGDHYAQKIEQHFDNSTGGILHFGVEE